MGHGHILVVDDEPQMQRVLRASLVAHGYEVCEATSGEEALKKVNDGCDCVLLDLNLPALDGIAVCRGIRTKASVPIVAMSVRDSDEDKQRARLAGADAYIAKPFGIDELLGCIQAARAKTEYTKSEQETSSLEKRYHL